MGRGAIIQSRETRQIVQGKRGGIRVFEDRAEASAEISSVVGEKGATDHFFFIPCWSTPVKLRSRATSAPSSLAKLGSPSRFSRPVPRPDPVDSCWTGNGARGLSAVRLLLSDLCLVCSGLFISPLTAALLQPSPFPIESWDAFPRR